MSELLALLNGRVVGVVQQSSNGDVSFTYDDGWRDRAEAYPLSLSMPLTKREHADAVVRAFMDGLLPDNRAILERWAVEFRVSPRNPFALLQHMGEDCAGAVQFVRAERLDSVLDPGQSTVDWLTEEEVGARLRDLVEAQGRGRLPGDHGQFSLAGAQPKTALFYTGGRWGIPSGSLPTTHILKPPAQRDLHGFDVNEHFCLRVARHLGLNVVDSTVQTFDGQPAIVVARYDRRWTTGTKTPGGRLPSAGNTTVDEVRSRRWAGRSRDHPTADRSG
jgi:serine/threonine-protein kinase HipA